MTCNLRGLRGFEFNSAKRKRCNIEKSQSENWNFFIFRSESRLCSILCQNKVNFDYPYAAIQTDLKNNFLFFKMSWLIKKENMQSIITFLSDKNNPVLVKALCISRKTRTTFFIFTLHFLYFDSLRAVESPRREYLNSSYSSSPTCIILRLECLSRPLSSLLSPTVSYRIRLP